MIIYELLPYSFWLTILSRSMAGLPMQQNRRTFLRNSALTGGAMTLRGLSNEGHALAVSLHAGATGSDSASVRQQFQSPAKKYRPIVRWWWPGNAVTESELRREIGALDQAGFGGAEIQPFSKSLPLDFSAAHQDQINSFATPSYFRHVAVAADEARRRGMFVDYTFGSGWPFGGGDAITPELASVELRSTRISVRGPAKLSERLQFPSVTDGDLLTGKDKLKGLPEGWTERIQKRSRVVGVVAVRGTEPQYVFYHSGPEQAVAWPGQLEKGSAVDLTARLSADGTLQWDMPEGTWQIFVYCSLPTCQRVYAGCGPGPQLVMDHLSAAAFAAHAKRVGGDSLAYLGEYLGNGLRAVFCDSLEVSASLFWSDDFLAEFRRRRGYELTPFLPLLEVQTYEEPFGKFVNMPVFAMDGQDERVREDYRRTVSDLITERCYEQFNQWAHAHNLLSRTQAHGAPADVLRIYGESDIPETEDLYDQGDYDFLKMAASAAHIYGRSMVGSESFVWRTAAYQTTPEKMKLAADELLTAGTNAIVYHGFAYQVPGAPAPGWHPFSGIGDGNYSSQFNELNPLWPYFGKLNSYLTRLQYMSQVGTNVSAVALYWKDVADGAEEAPPTPRLNRALLDAGYNYDHINPDSLLHCTVGERRLVTAGGAEYRAVVLPRLEAMDAAVAEKLADFAKAGLPVVFAGEPPAHAEGLLANPENARRLQSAMHSLHDSASVHFVTNIGSALAMLRQATAPNIRFRGKPLAFIQKRIGRLNTYFLRNPSDAAQHLVAAFEAEGSPELWDPWTGQTSIITSRRSGDWVEVELDIEPLASALIVFDPEHASAAPATTAAADTENGAPSRAIEIGANGWKLQATGMVPSGKAKEIDRELPRLIDWSLDSELRGFSGRGVYSTTFSAPRADPSHRLLLDLGRVKEVADVRINGKPVATLLLRPYQTDITEFIQPGANTLEVAVTNTLYNSMTLREPRTFRPGPAENSSGLMSGGLIGPVQLKVTTPRR